MAAHHLHGDEALVIETKHNPDSAPISAKLKALLAIARKVQKGGRQTSDIERARMEGATDVEIHDTVLIAAAFCRYNRYVDGLATWAPQNAELYRQQGARLATEGYVSSTDSVPLAVPQAV